MRKPEHVALLTAVGCLVGKINKVIKSLIVEDYLQMKRTSKFKEL